MKKIGIFFFSFLLIGGMQACKKEARPQVPASLLGKWSLRQYSITTTSNGVTGEPMVTAYNDTARYLYYQFNADGSGLEQVNADPNFIAAAAGFTFTVGGSMINFSHNSPLMMATKCSYELTSGTQLIIRGSYSSSGPGGTVTNLQELTLDK